MKRYKRHSANSNGTINIESAVDVIGASFHPALIGKALRSCCASRRSAFTAPTTISAISEVRIAELIVLAQHKEHESIGEAQKSYSPHVTYCFRNCLLISLY